MDPLPSSSSDEHIAQRSAAIARSAALHAFTHLDARILRTIQWATFISSILSVAGLWLVHNRFLPGYTYHEWAFYVTVIGLPVFGFLQLLWMPFTERKARFYIVSFHLLAITDYVFVISYNTVFIFVWLLLIMASDAFIGRRAMYASMTSFLGSMLIWWWLNIHRVPEASLVFFLLFNLAIFICVIALVVSRIRIISEQRGVEVEYSRQQERLESERLVALINSMGDAVIAMNQRGEVNVYNAAASSLLDTNVSLIGKRGTDVLHLVDGAGQPIDFDKLLAELKGNVVRTDLSHQFRNTERVNLYLNISPIHLGFQKPGERGYIMILRDITKEKSLEQERDEFISVASHELRTPVAIAEGSLSNVIVLKERGTVDPKLIDQAIKGAHDQVVLLAKMVNDLATLSRAERRVGIEVEPVDISALLDKLHADYVPEAQAKGLEFITEAKGKLGTLQTSQLYLQEILQNFITNALKYTKQGSITVTAEMDAQQRGIFKVRDTGIGISKSDQKHLYEKFWRSEDYRTRESSGTGLGLYLVKKLAEQLGATITFESQLNHGTTFTLLVPPYKEAEEVAPSGVQPARQTPSVLKQAVALEGETLVGPTQPTAGK